MKGFLNEVMVIFITSLLQQLSGGPIAFLFPSPPPLDRSRAASPLSPTNSLGSVRSPAHGFIEKPTGQFCKEVAKMLVEKYPFMADSGSTPSDLKSVT